MFVSVPRVEYREAGSPHAVQKTWSPELQPNQNSRAALSHDGGKCEITAACTSRNEEKVSAPPNVNHVPPLECVRSWWLRGRKCGRRERGCRPSWSTSEGVWHYPTCSGAGASSTATRPGDLQRRSSCAVLSERWHDTHHGGRGNLATLRTAGTGRSQLSSFLSSLLLPSSLSYLKA